MLLGLAACGSEEMVEIADGASEGAGPRINITVSTPSSGGVVVRSAKTRATVPAGVDESHVKSLNVYLFKKEGAGDTDADYLYFATYPFLDGALTDGGNGSKLCSIDIPKELTGATVKIALTANDGGTLPLHKGVTTLADFKGTEATAFATDNAKADVLMGGENFKGFPMAAMIGEAVLPTPMGVDVQATLVRNVARLDIFNHTPNLKITAVRIGNVNNRSCLFGTPGGLNIPTEYAYKVTLNPLKEFSDKLRGGLAYVNPPSGYSARDVNTHRLAYLYEQAVADDAGSPVVTIDYTLDIGGVEQPGTVDVKFLRSADNTFVDVTRNTLYRIRLGDGGTVGTGAVKAVFEVADWNEGSDIGSSLNPGTEVEPPVLDYSHAALGDIMLRDGTLVKGDAITEEQKAQAIGIVAFLYSDARGPKDGVRNALAAKKQNNPTGLVLALKNAGTGIVTWGPTNTNAGYALENLNTTYADGQDGYTITSDLAQKNDYIAFIEAVGYEASVSTRGITCTGWYLPSLGEWIDIMGSAGIGNISEVDDLKTSTWSGRELNNKARQAAANLNSHLDKIGGSFVRKFFTDTSISDSYWSSSENSETSAYYLNFYPYGALGFNRSSKDVGRRVRCVLAF